MLGSTLPLNLPNHGSLVIPILFHQLYQSYTASNVMKLLNHVPKYMDSSSYPHIDVILVYTDGLSVQSNTAGVGTRRNVQTNLSSHRRSIINGYHSKNWDARTVHFLAWNQTVLMSDLFNKSVVEINKIAQRNTPFVTCLQRDLESLSLVKGDEALLIEFLVFQSQVRQMQIPLPKFGPVANRWNLLCNFGPRLLSENWLLANKVLVDSKNLFNAHTYHCATDALVAG
jgi:hypothetical protein